MKYLPLTALFALLAAACTSSGKPDEVGKADNEPLTGSAIYNTHCAICHGDNGRKGLAGAKIIPESLYSVEERIALITSGKGNMMPYRDILTKDEIKRVAEYTLTLE